LVGLTTKAFSGVEQLIRIELGRCKVSHDRFTRAHPR
jgi:hypothetical protein